MLAGKPGKRILITGITGFVGSHMADVLVYKPYTEVFGTKRWHHSSMQNVQGIADKINWIDCDLTDAIGTRQMIEKVQPDEVYHFAAESFVSPSWVHPDQYMRVNYGATVNLLESVHRCGLKTRILIPGSGEEYGDVLPSDLPITPSTQLRPVNPYAVTKIAQDFIGSVYFRSYGVNVIRTRAFNHEGPRRQNVFGIPWYAYQIARLEAGQQGPVLKVGHLDDLRNFTHVADMVDAYELAMQKCEPDKLYLIGTQDIHTFSEALNRLCDKSYYTGKITYEQVAEFTRPTHVPYLIADVDLFVNLTGWKPKYTFEDILYDTLSYWRDQVRKGLV